MNRNSVKAQNQKINDQKIEIVIAANNKIALLSEIQNQSGIFSNKMNKNILKLGKGFNYFLFISKYVTLSLRD